MRIDKYFKISRIIKRRAEAKKACDTHSVLINGRIAKPGDNVKTQDIISIYFRDKILEIVVLEVPVGNVPVSRSSQLYRITKEEKRYFDEE
ncbi:MAG: S4 domain-containing protein [Atribacterota bacterium]|nr:S4 domain-containing protein [Atribacterota bacterium]